MIIEMRYWYDSQAEKYGISVIIATIKTEYQVSNNNYNNNDKSLPTMIGEALRPLYKLADLGYQVRRYNGSDKSPDYRPLNNKEEQELIRALGRIKPHQKAN